MAQTTYSLENPIAYEGMPAYGFAEYFTAINATRQLSSIVFTAANAEDYVLNINGVAFTYTSDGSATATEIRDALKALIDADTSLPVTVSTLSTNGLYIESTDRESGFTITNVGSDTVGNVVITEAQGQDQKIPFGKVVVWDDRGADNECRLPTAAADIGDRTFGVAAGDHGLQGDCCEPFAGYPDGSAISVLRKGTIWVICEDALTTVGKDVYVRYAAGSGGSELGSVRSDADGSTAAILNGASFRGKCEAGGLVKLELNLTN